ncbi:MAG TPA: hypothetical protein VLT47_00215 [Anaeromyxobacteraceae bacterium]|nr:hypothetical protein [Anaeromyxobacteraceae bacterium]
MSGWWLYGVAFAALTLSLLADRGRTRAALRAAGASFAKILPTVAGMMLLVGLLTALVPPAAIAHAIGPGSGVRGVVTALLLGSGVMLPSFIAFPLAGSLLEAGAGYGQVAAFVSTVMSVGTVTLPLEARAFGWRAAALRNALALLVAVLFSAIVAVVLG